MTRRPAARRRQWPLSVSGANAVRTNTTLLGIAAGVVAGAFWGLVFLAPRLAAGFPPLQLSAARYLAYGVVAVVLVAPSWRRLKGALGWRAWRALAWLSFIGNILYYVLLAQAVQTGGVAMTAFVIGLLPLAVTLVGSRGREAPSLRALLPSLACSALGLVCISWQSLAASGLGSVTGLLCAGGALLSWTTYAVSNSRWLARLDHVSAQDWSLLTGAVTGLEAIVLAVPAFYGDALVHTGADWRRFAGLAGAMALFCSVLGNGLWNIASRALPLTLTGQMIVFETIFASLYGYLWEGRWPAPLEGLALTLLVAGVVMCARAHRGDARAARPRVDAETRARA
jgi:drug/metabolite transporter (DMT)-like permease